MQAFLWSGNNAALAVWMLTSEFPWWIEWPCWFAFEDLESRIGDGEGERATWNVGLPLQLLRGEWSMLP